LSSEKRRANKKKLVAAGRAARRPAIERVSARGGGYTGFLWREWHRFEAHDIGARSLSFGAAELDGSGIQEGRLSYGERYLA
jgi:hypothetical protein